MKRSTGVNALMALISAVLIVLFSRLSFSEAINQLTALYVIAALGLLVLVCLLVALWRWRQMGVAGIQKAAIYVPLTIGMVLGGWNAMVVFQAMSVPAIHDISTDLENPPGFVSLRNVRAAAPNGVQWAGAELAAIQQSAYPDIKAIHTSLQPVQSFVVLRNMTVARGWDVAEANAEEGRIEASVRTRFMGFVDDVVIRIVKDGDGSRIDIRSMSRLGQSDLGANANRIRQLRQDFEQQAARF